MRFETRTLGVFEVLGVHLEADQAFDAGRLRQETLRLVEKGSRSIVVDLGSIDYLYSDSINAFVALNKRLLESSGHLAILVPHQKVYDILTRAGLEDFMRLYRTEAELWAASRELMRQSSAWTRPSELLNAASASQIISTTNLVPRSGESSREIPGSSQRASKRRTGPKAEIMSRRRDGRRLDQPGQEAPLPPALPQTGSDSSSLRNLSKESSSFDIPPPSPRRDRKPDPEVAPPLPQALPSVEPTIYQLPQDPEPDGYSTDAWLLALTSQPLPPVQTAHVGLDSSGFLPKLGTDLTLSPPMPPGAPPEVGPSKIDNGLRWQEEIPAMDVPKPKTSDEAASKQNSPPLHEDPFSKGFPPIPTEARYSGTPHFEIDAVKNAIFHEFPTLPPPPVEKFPKPAGLPPASDAKPVTMVDDWFGSAKRTPPVAPTTPLPAVVGIRAPESKASSPEEEWFTQPPPRLMPSVRDRPAETDSWFGNPGAPQTSIAPIPTRVPRPQAKKAEPSFIDSEEFEAPPSKRKGVGFWIVVLLGILLVLGGLAVLVGVMSDHRSSDVPPVTNTAVQTPAAPVSSQNPSSTESDEAAAREAAQAKSGNRKSPQPPAPTVVSAPVPPPEEERAPVKVFVTSRPSGANLSLDGKAAGTTPCEIVVKRNGNLDFSLAGYRTLHQAIDPDEIHGTLNVHLLSDEGGGVAGRIYISSSPSGADILLGSRVLGKTPRLVDLPTGSQKITVKSGVQSQTKTLDISSGTNPSENFSL